MTILQAIDSGDGSGATFIVSGNTGTATIYVSRFYGSNESRTWVVAGTVSGNGELEVALDIGPYAVFCIDGSNVPTAPFNFRVTDGSLPPFRRAMEAVREYVMGLALSYVSADPDDHRIVKLPYRADLELDLRDSNRQFGVFYFPVNDPVSVFDNQTNEIKYIVQILFARKFGQKMETGLDDILWARGLLTQAIHGNALSDENCINTVNFKPGAVIMREEWLASYDVTSVICECLTEQVAKVA